MKWSEGKKNYLRWLVTLKYQTERVKNPHITKFQCLALVVNELNIKVRENETEETKKGNPDSR